MKTNKEIRILGVGESVIDNVILVDDINQMPKVSEKGTRHIGGPVLAAMVALSRLGVDCTFVTATGKDHEGDIILETLAKENIKVIRHPLIKTIVNTMLVDKISGERKKILDKTINPDVISLRPDFVKSYDLFIVDRHVKTAFDDIMRMKKQGAPVVIDPSNVVSPLTLDMIENAEYPIIPIEALSAFAHGSLTNRLKKLFKLTQKPVIITCGKDGSIIYDGIKAKLIPPYSVKPVDVTGAGDIFRGAFAYGVINGWDLVKSADFANFVASRQCLRMGNVAAIPDKEEMLSIDKHKVKRSITGNLYAILSGNSLNK